MITLSDLQKLFPSIYNVTDNTNIRKILEVVQESFADISVDIEAVRTLKTLATIAGQPLTEWAASYGISRGGFTDAFLRIFLAASLNNQVTGNTITAILHFVGLQYIDFHVVELSRDELGHNLGGTRPLDGTHVLDGGSTGYEMAAFDVIINETIIDLSFLSGVLGDYMKAAGVRAYINLLGMGGYGVGAYGAEYYGEGESGQYP